MAAAIILAVAAPASCQSAPAATAPRTFALPEQREDLEITVPTAWAARLVEGKAPMIVFTPPTGRTFRLITVVLWDQRGGRLSPDTVRALTADALERARANDTVTQPGLFEVRGAEAIGWYFRYTDGRVATRPLPAEEYPHVTVGAVVVGDLALMITLHAEDPGGTEQAAVVALMSSARQRR